MKKYNQICRNAEITGMREDPTVAYDEDTTPCKFFYSGRNREFLPRVCGNCNWYTVQEKANKVEPIKVREEAMAMATA